MFPNIHSLFHVTLFISTLSNIATEAPLEATKRSTNELKREPWHPSELGLPPFKAAPIPIKPGEDIKGIA